MYHLIFLIILAGIWLVFASIYDLKKRMVPNWLSFSLIIFALGFRFFYSLFESESYLFFYQGLIGLGIFFIVGNALYYGRMFAGGDAKLMMALGVILPFSMDLLKNLELFFLFVILFLFAGGFYGLIWSVFLTLNNFKIFKKEFTNQFNNKKNKEIVYAVMAFALVIMVYGLFETLFFYLGILIFIMPYFYIYARSIDNSCLIKSTFVSKLEEGDWLYEDLKIGRNTIKSKWRGLTKEEIKIIKKNHKKIMIRQGIPFVPAFLISFLAFVYFYFQNISLFSFL